MSPSENSKHFQLNLRIIEASQLPISNAVTQVFVNVGNQRKRVRAKTKKTQNPYFDETLTFSFNEPLEQFVNRHLRIAVHKVKCNKLIGLCDIELKTIWSHPGRQVYQKWAVLADPKDALPTHKGYIKCDIILIEEGVPPFVPEPESSQEIDRNLLVPAGISYRRQNALFTFNVYRADRLRCRHEQCYRESFVVCNKLFVKVHFAEKTVKTKVVKGVEPVWNQAMTFVEPIPSLFETITIELWEKKLNLLVGSTVLPFSQLCQQLQVGQMPSFGPAFIYLYQFSRECPHLPNLSARLLFSLKCELVDTMNPIKNFPKTKITPCDENLFGPCETYMLFLAVFHCVFFNKRFFNKCEINVEHGSGNCNPGIQLNASGKMQDRSCQPYFSWQCQSLIPSAMACSQWVATDYREKRSNHIFNLMLGVSMKIGSLAKVHDFKEKSQLLRDIMKAICKVSTAILSLAPLPYETNLEKAQNTELKKILKTAKSNAEKYLKEAILPAEEITDSLQTFVYSAMEIVEENYASFPNFELVITKLPQMMKKTGVSFRSQDCLYSKNPIERGRNCGKAQTLFLSDARGYEIGALEVFLWFGRESEVRDCIEMLTGDPPQNEDDIQDISTTEVHYFELRVHIYQGRLNPGLDDSGLADAFVRVIAFGQCQETAVRAQSLDPIWDETLIFPEVRLFGKPHIIQKLSSGVVFEVLDYDGKDKVELVGRAAYRPKVTLLGDSYIPARLTRQPIHRFHDVSGEIVMAMELIEKSEDATEMIDQSKTYSVPEEVRPHNAAYFLDVIFWGVRNCKPSNCCQLPKLMGLIEINGARLESSLVKSDWSVNFDCQTQRVEVLLPSEEEYTPALSVGLYEFKSFNKSSYRGGALLANVQQFQRKQKFQENEPNSPIAIQIPRKESTHIVELAERPDWWSKYYASKVAQRNRRIIKIYKQELEFEPEFDAFQDFLYRFHLTRGKTNENKRSTPEYVGALKCNVFLSPKSMESNGPQSSYFRNESLDVTIRVYIVAAHDLAQTDINGRCDPYIVLSFGNAKISDRKNYIYKDTDPTFGKCFEIKGTLPWDHVLCVKVMDHDVCMTDNMVGETFIDIENRFYTKYRAACGIADTYESDGYCKWRDTMEPTEILEQLCRVNQLTTPEYTDNGVNIENYTVDIENGESRNSLALRILKNLDLIPPFGYTLVPEHVETRSLYHPMKPRIAQGKLEMWVDVFPGHGSLPPAVDITPRPPEELQLRVIVWNTAEVLSSDVNLLTMEESIDVYVVAWLTTSGESQTTDVHYRSLTGEGAFNWRFVFPFLYSPSDLKMIIYKRAVLGEGMRKEKIPPKLELQVWDNDILIDDFIGSLTLHLCNMPQGAQSAKSCSLDMWKPNYPRISLFKLKRIRGWWPFKAKGRENELIAGKIDMELELVTKEQANVSPVGVGREPPQPLPEPKRPGTNSFFFWGFNPLKILRKIAFGNIGRKLLIVTAIACLGVFVLSGWLAIPGILLNKWVNSSGYSV